MTVALFDFDGTLIDCNSARLWLQSEWRAGRVAKRDVARAAWFLARYSLGQGELEHAYEWAVARIAGQAEAALDAQTRAWFEREVRHRLRPGAVEAIERHRSAGHTLVIATSSSAYVAEAAREAYGFDAAIATGFEVVDGHFTGRVSESAYGPAKRGCVQAWAAEQGVDLATATFYTDSATDLALMEVVGRPVAVNPDRRLARLASGRGWEIADCGVQAHG